MNDQNVQLVSETVMVPKEAKEVKDLLLTLVKDIKAKKSVSEITSDCFPKLVTAIEGFDQLSAEAKAPQIAVLAGLLGGQVGEILLTSAPSQPSA